MVNKDEYKIVEVRLSRLMQWKLFCRTKDTVAADEQHNEINTDDDAERPNTAVRLDSVVHHHVPIFAGQYLYSEHQRCYDDITQYNNFVENTDRQIDMSKTHSFTQTYRFFYLRTHIRILKLPMAASISDISKTLLLTIVTELSSQSFT